MTGPSLRSWGLPGPFEQRVLPLQSTAPGEIPADDLLLAHGNGRSYGDVCLNQNHTLLHTRRLEHYLAFDAENGLLRCEAGVLLADIIRDFLPRGWFLPVTPGTRFVTVGGAIANDVHGKNHHAAGSFGDHVESLTLLRSSGESITCSRTSNASLFAATIAGLGLTGLITSASIRLRRVASGWMRVTSRRFESLDEFLQLNAALEPQHEYTVSWIDCLSARNRRLRGVYMAGNHADSNELAQRPVYPDEPVARRLPFTPPVSLVAGPTLRAFNSLYWWKSRDVENSLQSLFSYFYPLDALLEWNRMYGPHGFFQYQCVLPMASGKEAATELLETVTDNGAGSFLAVLKTFADRPAPGLLSFSRSGITIALDFPNHGASTQRLFDQLNLIVQQYGGAIYPAKDACMPAALFAAAYPRLEEFKQYKDPRYSSSLWRRLTGAS